MIRSKLNLILWCMGLLVMASPIRSALPNYYQTKTLSFNNANDLYYTPANPAYLEDLKEWEINYGWASQNSSQIFLGTRSLGFGIQQDGQGSEYRLLTSWGESEYNAGFGVVWGAGATVRKATALQFGIIKRPNEQLSYALSGEFEPQGGQRAVLEFGFRPQGTDFLTLGGDYVIENEVKWSVHASSVMFPGATLALRYYSDQTAAIGLSIGLGAMSYAHHSGPDSVQSLRWAKTPGPVISRHFVQPSPRYIEWKLDDDIQYQRYKFFDNGDTLLEVLSQIKKAKNNPDVQGISLDLADFDLSPALTWEIRNALLDFKQQGKKIVAYIERPEWTTYYLATVADWIVMHPLGGVGLLGLSSGRTYYKGLLDKIGVGVEEMRLFKYKSAYEDLASEKMSTADRTQRIALVQNYYELMREAVVLTRGVSSDAFEKIINETPLLQAQACLDFGLVNQLGTSEDISDRWVSVNRTIKPAGLGILTPKATTKWGETPVIAVVYALGVCDMDSGIKARSLSKTIKALADEPLVKAIVVRVDSPGGDVLASELVAQQIRNGNKKKPIWISMGQVAASGGYWISMYGKKIVTSPLTYTGSIGVISKWMYNKGIGEMTGMTQDFIQKGAHADLFQGIKIPFVGVTIPNRPLTQTEKEMFHNSINQSYIEFVERVAQSRGRATKDIEAIAQGRVWSGSDAIKNGLADYEGGLDTAIQYAKEDAGLASASEVEIMEFPSKGLWDLKSMVLGQSNRLPTMEADIDYLIFQTKNQGKILHLMED